MKTIKSFKLVKEFLYQRSHHKMKRQIKKNLRKLEKQWEVSRFNAG